MRRQVRVLLAWMERAEAVSALLGFRLPAEGEDISSQLEAYDAARAALEERAEFEETGTGVEPLPSGMEARAESALKSLLPFLARDDTIQRFSAGLVDLTKVVSFQKAVTLEPVASYASDVKQENWPKLAELCLTEAAEIDELNGTFDRDGSGVTITSSNVNLRVAPIRSVTLPGEHGHLIGFTLTFGTTHVHVVEYKDRLFLKDGYHRCHHLLQNGITRVPAIIERARTFGDVHVEGANTVTQEHLLGKRPPILMDFLNADLSVTLSQQAFRKVIRIRAEEFLVNV